MNQTPIYGFNGFGKSPINANANGCFCCPGGSHASRTENAPPSISSTSQVGDAFQSMSLISNGGWNDIRLDYLTDDFQRMCGMTNAIALPPLPAPPPANHRERYLI
jgi:hypothetical protein